MTSTSEATSALLFDLRILASGPLLVGFDFFDFCDGISLDSFYFAILWFETNGVPSAVIHPTHSPFIAFDFGCICIGGN
jgi:hypothetical protein